MILVPTFIYFVMQLKTILVIIKGVLIVIIFKSTEKYSKGVKKKRIMANIIITLLAGMNDYINFLLDAIIRPSALIVDLDAHL